jgi:predicted metal-dependent hydrolase
LESVWLEGVPPVEILLRRSGRARRITLRVSASDGRVTLTVPRGVPEAEAIAFASQKSGWIRENLQRNPVPAPIGLGDTLPLEGRPVPLVAGAGRRLRLTEAGLEMPPNATGARLTGFLKTLARDRLVSASDHYAAKLGRSYQCITLRDTRSRWGSCSSAGRLMYSWRLILAPPDVLRYVAAHEVAHLVEMNHSPDFWALVERIYGPHKAARAWLRKEGLSIQRIRFAD